MNKCEMCGRSVQSGPLTYSVEYGVWLCNDCLNSVVETNKNLFDKAFTESLFKHCKSVYVPYSKIKEENKMKAKRDVTKKETVSLMSVSELKPRDEIKVKVGENVYKAIVIREPHWSGDADRCLDISVLLNSPIKSMTWEDLGYNSFEDMIDDIAKEHKEGRNANLSTYIKIHDAAHEGKKYVYADTFGKSIIRVINNDGSSTIYDTDQFQVYLEEEDD